MISVVIPAYRNTEQFVKNLTQNLFFLTDCEVIVVNDYPHESLKTALGIFPHVKLFENAQNLGFAGTVNVGVEKATGEYVMLLNTDVVLLDDSYKKALMHFQTDPQLFAVSFAQKEKDGTIIGANKLYWERGLFHHEKGPVDTLHKNAWAEGGTCMIDIKKFRQLQGFNSFYKPYYWEDIDLSYRAWKAGYTVLFDPGILMEHHHESTIGTYFQQQFTNIIAFRNQFMFTWINLTSFQLLLKHLLFLPYYVMIQGAVKGNKGLVVGFCKALKRLSTILHLRKFYQKTARLSDEETLKALSYE